MVIIIIIIVMVGVWLLRIARVVVRHNLDRVCNIALPLRAGSLAVITSGEPIQDHATNYLALVITVVKHVYSVLSLPVPLLPPSLSRRPSPSLPPSPSPFRTPSSPVTAPTPGYE
jgi:hypothetical protein